MASSFPGAIDNFTDPLSNSPLNSPSHSGQHSDLNDAVEKIETYMGLVKVIPTGATNGTVGATGTVTFTNVASVTINGAFSTGYANYKLVWRINSTAAANAELRMRLTAGGVAATTGYIAGYRVFNPAAGTNTIDGNATSTVHMPCGNLGEPGFSPTTADFLLCNPYVAASTVLSGTGAGLASSVIWTAIWVGGHLPNTTLYDGFQLFPSVNNMTGTVTVYGLRN